MTTSKNKRTYSRLSYRRRVQAKTCLGASSNYAIIISGEFPLCINISECRVASIQSYINQSIANRIAQHKVVQEVMP